MFDAEIYREILGYEASDTEDSVTEGAIPVNDVSSSISACSSIAEGAYFTKNGGLPFRNSPGQEFLRLTRSGSVPTISSLPQSIGLEATTVQIANQRLREKIEKMCQTIKRQSNTLNQLRAETHLPQDLGISPYIDGGSGVNDELRASPGAGSAGLFMRGVGNSNRPGRLGKHAEAYATSTSIPHAATSSRSSPAHVSNACAVEFGTSTLNSGLRRASHAGSISPQDAISAAANSNGLAGTLGRYPSDSRLPLFSPALDPLPHSCQYVSRRNGGAPSNTAPQLNARAATQAIPSYGLVPDEPSTPSAAIPHLTEPQPSMSGGRVLAADAPSPSKVPPWSQQRRDFMQRPIKSHRERAQSTAGAWSADVLTQRGRVQEQNNSITSWDALSPICAEPTEDCGVPLPKTLLRGMSSPALSTLSHSDVSRHGTPNCQIVGGVSRQSGRCAVDKSARKRHNVGKGTPLQKDLSALVSPSGGGRIRRSGQDLSRERQNFTSPDSDSALPPALCEEPMMFLHEDLDEQPLASQDLPNGLLVCESPEPLTDKTVKSSTSPRAESPSASSKIRHGENTMHHGGRRTSEDHGKRPRSSQGAATVVTQPDYHPRRGARTAPGVKTEPSSALGAMPRRQSIAQLTAQMDGPSVVQSDEELDFGETPRNRQQGRAMALEDRKVSAVRQPTYRGSEHHIRRIYDQLERERKPNISVQRESLHSDDSSDIPDEKSVPGVQTLPNSKHDISSDVVKTPVKEEPTSCTEKENEPVENKHDNHVHQPNSSSMPGSVATGAAPCSPSKAATESPRSTSKDRKMLHSPPTLPSPPPLSPTANPSGHIVRAVALASAATPDAARGARADTALAAAGLSPASTISAMEQSPTASPSGRNPELRATPFSDSLPPKEEKGKADNKAATPNLETASAKAEPPPPTVEKKVLPAPPENVLKSTLPTSEKANKPALAEDSTKKNVPSDGEGSNEEEGAEDEEEEEDEGEEEEEEEYEEEEEEEEEGESEASVEAARPGVAKAKAEASKVQAPASKVGGSSPGAPTVAALAALATGKPPSVPPAMAKSKIAGPLPAVAKPASPPPAGAKNAGAAILQRMQAKPSSEVAAKAKMAGLSPAVAGKPSSPGPPPAVAGKPSGPPPAVAGKPSGPPPTVAGKPAAPPAATKNAGAAILQRMAPSPKVVAKPSSEPASKAKNAGAAILQRMNASRAAE